MRIKRTRIGTHSGGRWRAVCAGAALALLVLAGPGAEANPNDLESGAVARQAGASAADTGIDSGWRDLGWGRRTVTLGRFTSTRPVLLTVTDAFCRGDVFKLWDGDRLLGRTSAAPIDDCAPPLIRRPWRALRDDSYSHGSFVLRPGTHVIRLRAVVNPYGGGGAFFRLDSPGRMWGVLRSAQAPGQ